MRISRIEFENFRNFKNHGEIFCSTDGKVTVIYGKNGDGKTTLHQLLQWVFYGKVSFNKTTTNTLYNWEYENEQPYNKVFKVLGRIDFEHQSVKYSLSRVNTYKKELSSSSLLNEELELNVLDDEDNWKRVDKPQDTIEKLLPSGLSDYFFFDGENMIADLRIKGRDSAKNLRGSLYSILDLDLIESALSHIGETDLKTTVLGKIYLSKADIQSGSEIDATKQNIENAQTKIKDYKDAIDRVKNEEVQLKNFINEVSEQIGMTKSKEQYENERKSLIDQREAFLKNAKREETEFGEKLYRMYPQLLISKAVNDAKKKIHLKVEESSIPDGLDKRLIAYLTGLNNEKCICGRDLSEEHKCYIKQYLNYMPPNNYDSLYINFDNKAKIWGEGYERELLDSHIIGAMDNQENATKCDIKIKELDDEEKKSKDIEKLITDRRNAEERCEEIEDLITKYSSEKTTYEKYLKKEMKIFDELTEKTKLNKVICHRLEIMESVRKELKDELEEKSIKYGKLLQNNIQDLLNQMLTSKRIVSVGNDFSVRVVDSYKDESKSEGQFAVVSFAYIGGILKLVMNDTELVGKEYPLVLDGPFSKLDEDQRQNVIDCIPRFAPQVILFSKDSLQEYIPSDLLGRVYTITSNEEKNVAEVKEGYLWK